MKNLLAALVVSCAVPFAALAVESGKPAPAFEVMDIAAKAQSLKSYAGKIVVLEWNNPECPFVKKHYESGNMQSLQKELAGKGAVWLTVNSSASGKQGALSVEEANALLKQAGAAPSAYILDPKGEIGRLYTAKTTPHMYVIAKDGTLAYQGAIDDKPSFDKADITGAKNYVREAVDALLADKPVVTASTQAYGCSVKY